MIFTCEDCGAVAEDSCSLCSPTSEKPGGKFCGTIDLRVCEEKHSSIKYSCDACGSISEDPEYLCSPSQIK